MGAILLAAAINLFLCHRIVEAPQLLEQNFENFIGVFSVVFRKSIVLVLFVISIVSWLFQCFRLMTSLRNCTAIIYHYYQSYLQNEVPAVDMGSEELPEDTRYLMVVSWSLVFVGFMIHAKGIRNVERFARWSVTAAKVFGALIVVVAVYQAYRSFRNADEVIEIQYFRF